MPLPKSEIDSWSAIQNLEFMTTPAPYYGVNIYDVRTENWEALIDNQKRVKTITMKLPGYKPYYWAVRDYGEFRRVIWINYYEKTPDPDDPGVAELAEIFANDLMPEFCQLIEKYRWFITSETPSILK